MTWLAVSAGKKFFYKSGDCGVGFLGDFGDLLNGLFNINIDAKLPGFQPPSVTNTNNNGYVLVSKASYYDVVSSGRVLLDSFAFAESGSYTYNVPDLGSAITTPLRLKATIIGAGGGGAGSGRGPTTSGGSIFGTVSSYTKYSGGGGGAGESSVLDLGEVLPGTVININVGAGGSGGYGWENAADPSSNGISGESTTLEVNGQVYSANGGTGAEGLLGGSLYGESGSLARVRVGFLLGTGSVAPVGGKGGDSLFANGGESDQVGAYGSGGGGAGIPSIVPRNGASGGDGYVSLELYTIVS
jgi:hypothetical protein